MTNQNIENEVEQNCSKIASLLKLPHDFEEIQLLYLLNFSRNPDLIVAILIAFLPSRL
jgi:hypothetical protein